MGSDEHYNVCIHCEKDIYSVRNTAVLSWYHESNGKMLCTFGDGFTTYQATPNGRFV